MNRAERVALKEQMDRLEKKLNDALTRLELVEQKRGPGRPPKDNGLSDGRRETT